MTVNGLFRSAASAGFRSSLTHFLHLLRAGAIPLKTFAILHTRPHARYPRQGSQRFDRPHRVTDYANDHRVPHGFSHGMICTEQSDFLLRECHLQIKAPCGGLLLLRPVFRPSDTTHTEDAAEHSCHGYVSRLCRIYGVQQDLCHTSRSVWLLPWRVPHSTFHQLGWDSLGTNTVAWVSLALFHLLRNSWSSLYLRMYHACSR